MQRKATKNTRGRNAAEEHYQNWAKEQRCAFCGMPGPSINDHAEGATFRHNKVLIGHFYVVSKCQICDDAKTFGNYHDHLKQCGITHSDAWLEQAARYEQETGREIPPEVKASIGSLNR